MTRSRSYVNDLLKIRPRAAGAASRALEEPGDGSTRYVLDGCLPAPRLRVELHQRPLLGRYAHAHREAETFEVGRHEQVVVRPCPLGEQTCGVAGALGIGVPLEQLPRDCLHLDQRLAADVGEDQRLVLVPHRHRGDLDQRGCWILAELGIDRAERRVVVEDDLVGGERDQRAAAHCVMRDDCDDASVVIVQRPGDLTRREHESAGRVEDDLDLLSRRRRPDCPQHALGIVDVDVTHEREPEQRDRLLTVDERDHRRITPRCNPGKHPPSRQGQQLLLDEGLQRAEDEEEPDGVPRMDHGSTSPPGDAHASEADR